MNREQRRKAAKQQTPQNIERLARQEASAQMQKQFHGIVEQATAKTLLIVLYALRNEYGFSQKRLQRFLDRFNFDAMCIEDGENGVEGLPTLKDIERLIEQEVKIKLKY